eukprot:COSAG04_NODE_24349_length_323_cov_0.705357_1_plen_41_part_01
MGWGWPLSKLLDAMVEEHMLICTHQLKSVLKESGDFFLAHM